MEIHTLLKYPTFIFSGEVDSESASDCVQWLTANHTQKNLTIILTSSGGIVKYAMAVYDTIQLMSGATNIHIVATGRCESAATVILAAADHDKRYATPYTTFLTHSIITVKDDDRHPCVENVTDPALIEAMSTLSGVDLAEAYRLQEMFVEIYQTRIGLSEEKARELLSMKERIFSAQEAQEFGFIGRIIERSSPGLTRRASRWRKLTKKRS